MSTPTYTDAALAAMTDAAFKRATKRLAFHERYPLDRRRDAARLAVAAAKLTEPVYIVCPHEHGNGGWSGSGVLAVVERAAVFSIDPVRAYLGGYYQPTFGSMIRACLKPDPNNPLYRWDHDGAMWLASDGEALRGDEAAAESAARAKRDAKRARMWARIMAKLNPAERRFVRAR